MFNKPTTFKHKDIGITIHIPDYWYFNLTEWADVNKMTEEEKKEYPHYIVTTGFLRVFKYKEAWVNSFNKATSEDVKKTLMLPNFDYDIFEELSGITKSMIEKKLKEE